MKISKFVIKNFCFREKYFVDFLWYSQVMLGRRGIITRAATAATTAKLHIQKVITYILIFKADCENYRHFCDIAINN